jgi:hypothetical protein
MVVRAAVLKLKLDLAKKAVQNQRLDQEHPVG